MVSHTIIKDQRLKKWVKQADLWVFVLIQQNKTVLKQRSHEWGTAVCLAGPHVAGHAVQQHAQRHGERVLLRLRVDTQRCQVVQLHDIIVRACKVVYASVLYYLYYLSGAITQLIGIEC